MTNAVCKYYAPKNIDSNILIYLAMQMQPLCPKMTMLKPKPIDPNTNLPFFTHANVFLSKHDASPNFLFPVANASCRDATVDSMSMMLVPYYEDANADIYLMMQMLPYEDGNANSMM